jgi:pimeloyl-ACP methyl ester carboxylesterase
MGGDRAAEIIAAMRAELAAAGLKRVESDGLVWFRGGNGDATLLLLHGVNEQAGTWAPIVPSLASRFRLIIPDLAGHGASEPQAGPLPMETIIDGVHHVVQREATERLTILGNSMGGWVAMLYVLGHPERVEQLILEDASGMAWALTVPLFPRTTDEAILCLRAVHGPAYEPEQWMIDAMLERAISAPATRVMQGGNLMVHLLDGRLDQIRVPTALIWGRDDGLLPVLYAEALQKRIAGATLDVIDGAAHIPHRQQPERFLACLLETCSPSARA